MCGACDRMIRFGEEYDGHDKVSSSAGGITVYLHKKCLANPSRSRSRRVVSFPPHKPT
jgi:hypothetical protein